MDETTWTRLLAPALRVIDSLVDAGYGELDFRLGGGTVLMFAFAHRLSKDIGIFLDDAQALSFLSPRLNDVSAELATEYHEQGNSVKLILPEGDIDFIVAGTVTKVAETNVAAPPTLHFGGRAIALDSVAEILGKKLLYRAASFKPRDLYDVAVGLLLDPASTAAALAATRPVHDVLIRRFGAFEAVGEEALLADIHPSARRFTFPGGIVPFVTAAIVKADPRRNDESRDDDAAP